MSTIVLLDDHIQTSILWAALRRRPLKITGWELWLCGESHGPLFAPEPLNATAFDQASSNASVSVVKKAVVTPQDADVDVIVRGGYRRTQVAQDPVNAVCAAHDRRARSPVLLQGAVLCSPACCQYGA